MTAPTRRDRRRPRGHGRAPTIYVCMTCRPVGEPDSALRPGALLAAATERAAAGTEVEVRADAVPRQLHARPQRRACAPTARGPTCSAALT